MSTLMGWLTIPRTLFLWLDTIVFSLIDDVYDLFQIFASNQIFSDDAVNTLMNNIYVLISLVAFFRLAMLLVNAIIDPEKLFAKKEGLGNIFGRTLIMLVLIVTSPIIFKSLNELQTHIVDNNIIMRAIINTSSSQGVQAKDGSKYYSDAGKTMQKIVITTLLKPEEYFFENGEAGVQDYLNDTSINDDNESDSIAGAEKYVNSECNKTCKKAMARYHAVISDDTKSFKIRKLLSYIGASKDVDTDEGPEDVYYYEYVAILTTITGGFLTYVMLSWSIDIAVRSVELAVLRLISPLFIATIVDPKSTASGGYFNNWLKRYGKTYADLFLKLAIIALAILMISLVQDADIWNTTIGG